MQDSHPGLYITKKFYILCIFSIHLDVYRKCWLLYLNYFGYKEKYNLSEYQGKTFLKGNPNFQDILNWILQILHYYCRKQHKNIKNSRIIEQNLVLSFPFSLFTATCASCRLPQRQNFFISWTKYFTNSKRYKWSFVLYIVSFSGLKMIFTKFSL